MRRLFQIVVQSGVCSGCAACVVACAVDALEYEVDRPVLLDRCIDCVLCANACPRLEPAAIGSSCSAAPDGLLAIGPHIGILAARATSPDVRAVAQDGGVVTAILHWALEEGLIDGAVVSRRSPEAPWRPGPALVTRAADLLACAGSSYTYSANTLALADTASRGLSRIAFVGTGCQIAAVRQLQAAKSKKLRAIAASVVFAIGLLCSETFDYEPFVEGEIARGLAVDLRDVVKINIKGRVLVTLSSGELKSLPLKGVRPFARQGCHYCQDFGAEGADLSVGGLGLEGWTITTLRSVAGIDFFQGAARDGALEVQSAGQFPSALELYARLAERQRARPARPPAAEAGQ